MISKSEEQEDRSERTKEIRGDIAAHKMKVLNSVFTGSNLDALYRLFVRQTAVVPDQSYLPILAGLGIAGEAGEVVDLLKKVVFHSGHDMDKDRDRLIEEVGDLYWYLEVLKFLLGVDDDTIRRENMIKLARRNPERLDGWWERAGSVLPGGV